MNDFPPGVVPAHRIGPLREQARAARDAGISSLWVLQHYLGSMPTLQPIPLLAALAEDSGGMALGAQLVEMVGGGTEHGGSFRRRTRPPDTGVEGVDVMINNAASSAVRISSR